MSKRSLKICNKLGIKCILFNGSSPLKLLRKEMYEVKNQNTIFDSWIKYQQEEFDRASFIMVESQFVKQGIISLGIKSNKVKIIPPHVKTHSIQNESINRPFNICTIQINERKGFIDLISFLKTIDDWSNIRLNLFGSISKEHENLVKEYSEINCLGFLKKAEYYKSLSKMNLAIFPTYSDAGPRALFECMSLGICPVVSERSAGPDHIDDFVNGFVIPINDKQKWVDVLKYCIANPEKVKEMGLNAKHYVENKLDENFFPSKLKELL
jgi:glycosyltransferase involved in cell wall biosynthesis